MGYDILRSILSKLRAMYYCYKLIQGTARNLSLDDVGFLPAFIFPADSAVSAHFRAEAGWVNKVLCVMPWVAAVKNRRDLGARHWVQVAFCLMVQVHSLAMSSMSENSKGILSCTIFQIPWEIKCTQYCLVNWHYKGMPWLPSFAYSISRNTCTHTHFIHVTLKRTSVMKGWTVEAELLCSRVWVRWICSL